VLSINVVSFDIWNTLLDLNKFYSLIAVKLAGITGRSVELIWKNIVEAYKQALEARLEGVFKKPIYDSAVFFAEKLGVSIEDLFKAVVKAIEDPGIAELAYSDAEPALRELKKRGYKIALLGNVMFWPGMITRIILYKCGLLDYVDYSLFGDEVGVQKPSREVFTELARIADVKLSEILHVGDSLVNDMAGALLAGAAAVLVKRDFDKPVVRLGERAWVVKSLLNLLEILS